MTTETELNKAQLAAKQCLEVLGTFSLNMGQYNSNDNLPVMEDSVCNTTFCLAGYLAHMDGYPREYISSIDGVFFYGRYSLDKIGAEVYNNYLWIFLFGQHWPSDVELAKARCQYVLDHGEAPPEPEWVSYGWQ